jgi:putative serine protease PepD
MDKDLNPLEGAPTDRDREPTGTPPAQPAQPASPGPQTAPAQPAGQTANPTTWWQPRPGGVRDAGSSTGATVTGAHSYPAAGAPGYPAPGTTGYTTGGSTGYPMGSAPGYGQAWSNPYAATGGQSTHGQSAYGQHAQGQNPYAANNPAANNPAATGTTTVQPPRPANRGRRTTMVVAGTVIFALAAGFGAGALGARVTSDSASGSASHTLTQLASVSASKAAPADGSVEQVAATLLPTVVSVLSSSSSSAGEGSGVILTADGMILTNNHVISGATTLQVQFNDGTTAEATVVGADPTDDLAVIKATGVSGLTPATLGSSGDLQIGQPVIAVGSPLGLSATVTSGIVSALNRPVRTSSAEDQQQQQQQQQQLPGQDQQSQTSTSQDTVMNAIQTDAAINPGNSGGPLVDMSGNVIGINSAIASLSSSSSGEGGSIGVGFAIPIDQAKRIAQEIIDTGTATHAVLGASVGDATQGDNSLLTVGAKIADLTAGSGAEKAGLKSGDVITKLGSQTVDSADALIAAVRSAAPNSQVDVTYTRGTESNTVTVTLGSASAN